MVVGQQQCLPYGFCHCLQQSEDLPKECSATQYPADTNWTPFDEQWFQQWLAKGTLKQLSERKQLRIPSRSCVPLSGLWQLTAPPSSTNPITCPRHHTNPGAANKQHPNATAVQGLLSSPGNTQVGSKLRATSIVHPHANSISGHTLNSLSLFA